MTELQQWQGISGFLFVMLVVFQYLHQSRFKSMMRLIDKAIGLLNEAVNNKPERSA